MLVFLLIFASLCNLANGGAEAINVCSMPVPVPPQGGNVGQQRFVQRPTVPVDNCHDRDPAACSEIFKYAPGEVQVLAENLVS